MLVLVGFRFFFGGFYGFFEFGFVVVVFFCLVDWFVLVWFLLFFTVKGCGALCVRVFFLLSNSVSISVLILVEIKHSSSTSLEEVSVSAVVTELRPHLEVLLCLLVPLLF